MTHDGKLQIVVLVLAIMGALGAVLAWSKHTNAQKRRGAQPAPMQSEDAQ